MHGNEPIFLSYEYERIRDETIATVGEFWMLQIQKITTKVGAQAAACHPQVIWAQAQLRKLGEL